MALTPVEYTNKANNINSELDDLYSEINALPNAKHLDFVTAGAKQILVGYVGADTNGVPINGEHDPTPKVTNIATSKWSVGKGSNNGYLTIPFGIDADVYVAGGKLQCLSGNVLVYEHFSYLYVPEKGTHALEAYGYYSGTTSSKSFNATTKAATVTLSGQITDIDAVVSGYAYAIKF